MIAKVKGNKIEIKDPVTLVQGSVGQTLGVDLPTEWESLSVTAVFSAGAVQRDVPVLGDEITIPWEVLTNHHAPLTLCFHAAAADGQRVITTANCDPIRIAPSTAPSGQEPEAPSPSRADQIQALAQQALAAAQSVSTQAAQGAFNGRDGVDGTNGTDGADGISPAVSVSEIQGGHRIQITDAAGSRSFDVLDGAPGEVTEAELETALASKAESDGSYDSMTVGNAKQLVATVGVTDRVPYNFRTSGGSADIGDRASDKIVGGTIAWNQKVDSTAASVSVASSHKYIASISGTLSMGVSSGAALTVDGAGGDMVFDLTQMFGSAIADYVYGLEQANAGAGVAWFRKLFPKDYYAYNPGELMSVRTSAHETVGFNAYDHSTGKARIIGGLQYQITGAFTALSLNGAIVTPDANGFFTPSESGELLVSGGDSGTTCVHLVWDGERNGKYEPYVSHSYPLDSKLTLRGFPKLDSNNSFYYDGDTYESDGTVTRKYGEITLDGSESWSWNANNALAVKTIPGGIVTNATTQYYAWVMTDNGELHNSAWVGRQNNTPAIGMFYGLSAVFIKAQNITSAADAKAYFTAHPTTVLYMLAAPTVEEADPYQDPQIVDDFGTEKYVDYAETQGTREVSVPVGHITNYQPNLRAKLEMAPPSPAGDGDYLVRHNNGTNSYVKYTDGGRITALEAKLPTPPAVNGNYCLTVTVNGASSEYTWSTM